METSLFNELPSEIRNVIYLYALFEPEGVNINASPALLETCKQMRGEASEMYWAINTFKVNIHENATSHDVCQWLKHAGRRIRLIRSLTIHVEMPSVGSRDHTDDAIEDEAETTWSVGFLHLLHIIDALRKAEWCRPHLESVISFTLNSANDFETFESIEAMATAEQDRFQGSKFLLMCLAHGTTKVMEALEATDGEQLVEEMDRETRQRRLTHSSPSPVCIEAS